MPKPKHVTTTIDPMTGARVKVWACEGYRSAACGAWEYPDGTNCHDRCAGFVNAGEWGATECACECHRDTDTDCPVCGALVFPGGSVGRKVTAHDCPRWDTHGDGRE